MKGKANKRNSPGHRPKGVSDPVRAVFKSNSLIIVCLRGAWACSFGPHVCVESPPCPHYLLLGRPLGSPRALLE